MDKVANVRDEIVKTKIIPYMKAVQKKEDVRFYARIERIGPPQVGLAWQKKPEKKLLEIGASRYEERTQLIIETIFKDFISFCNECGVFPFATITGNGAEMCFSLTQKKQAEVLNVSPSIK